jgi:ferredoxin
MRTGLPGAACKARQANFSNIIMCETCQTGTFTSVSARITCGACSEVCQSQAFQIPKMVSTGQILIITTESFISTFSLRVSSIPALGANTVGKAPTFFPSGGYFGHPFLRFSKSTSTSNHDHLYISSACVTFTSGATVMFVVRFLETLSSYNAQTVLFSMQRSDEFIGFDVHLRTVSSVLNLCISTWSAGNTCTVANAPLNTWIRVVYTYHPSSSPRNRLVVE